MASGGPDEPDPASGELDLGAAAWQPLLRRYGPFVAVGLAGVVLGLAVPGVLVEDDLGFVPGDAEDTDAVATDTDLDAVTAQLEREGVRAFCDSYRELLECIEAKLGSTSLLV